MYKIDTTKYFDIRKVMKDFPEYNKFIIIAQNQCGKTYSCVRHIINNLVDKNKLEHE